MVSIPCPCPPMADGEPRHASDEVTLKPRLGFVEASAVRNRIAMHRAEIGEDELDPAEVLAVLTEGYIIHGLATWTLEDADGKPLPVTRANIRAFILDRWDIATDVADAADEQYAEAVMLPLLKTDSTSSPPSPTDGSTSPSPLSGTPAPKPLRPSSTSATPTDGTATTISSRAGGSKSSQSSSSAA